MKPSETMTLSALYARCQGVNFDGDWREGCETCLRRTSAAVGENQTWIEPPPIVVFDCEYLIEPSDVEAR